jgi:hypothetical protein
MAHRLSGQARSLIGVVLLIATVPASAQQYFLETRQVPLRTAVQQEQQLGSIARPSQRTITFSDFQLGGPIRFTRPYASLKPRPIVSYNFSVPDSVVRSIEVEIDSLNFLGTLASEREGYQESISRLPVFEHTYNSLQQELIALLGKPLKSEPLALRGNAAHAEYSQSDSWETPTLGAQLYLVFSTKATPPYSHAYRIRAQITYKNQAVAHGAPSSLSKGNAQQVAICSRFLSLLVAKRFTESWELVGPEIKNSLSFAQYVATFTPFVEQVGEQQPKVTLLMSGPLVSATGQQLAQYTYLVSGQKADSTPFHINLLFTDFSAYLIGGLQPRHMSTPILLSK